MRNCPRCGFEIIEASRFSAANDNISPIFVLRDHELLQREHVQYLAKYVAALSMSSRELPNFMADNIFEFKGAILWPDGRIFEVGDTDIDDAFNNDDSFRWVRDFRRRANVPLIQTPQARLIPRYRLIDLAVRIYIRNCEQGNE